MPDMKLPSYFYGDEAMQFTYFRIPCQLITHPRFKHLPTDSKLLYGMLLDRMSLSVKNECTSILPPTAPSTPAGPTPTASWRIR